MVLLLRYLVWLSDREPIAGMDLLLPRRGDSQAMEGAAGKGWRPGKCLDSSTAKLQASSAWMHKQITGLNLLLASFFAGTCCELAVRGYSSLNFEMLPLNKSKPENINSFYDMLDYLTRLTFYGCELSTFAHSAGLFVVQLTLSVAYQSVLEYYWHLLMHLPWFYRTFHKIHHTLKAPEVWDDLYIHPVEACGYYVILYSPAFVINMNIISFLSYMALLGVAGVVDHSGIRLAIPGLYDSRDHDRHHQYTNVNYAFPFPFLDILGGTYMEKEGRCHAIPIHMEKLFFDQ